MCTLHIWCLHQDPPGVFPEHRTNRKTWLIIGRFECDPKPNQNKITHKKENELWCIFNDPQELKLRGMEKSCQEFEFLSAMLFFSRKSQWRDKCLILENCCSQSPLLSPGPLPQILSSSLKCPFCPAGFEIHLSITPHLNVIHFFLYSYHDWKMGGLIGG